MQWRPRSGAFRKRWTVAQALFTLRSRPVRPAVLVEAGDVSVGFGGPAFGTGTYARPLHPISAVEPAVVQLIADGRPEVILESADDVAKAPAWTPPPMRPPPWARPAAPPTAPHAAQWATAHERQVTRLRPAVRPRRLAVSMRREY